MLRKGLKSVGWYNARFHTMCPSQPEEGLAKITGYVHVLNKTAMLYETTVQMDI